VDIHDNTTYHAYETGCELHRPADHYGRSEERIRQETGATRAEAIDLPAGPAKTVAVGFAQFLLLPDYGNGGGGNNPWCGTYIAATPYMGRITVEFLTGASGCLTSG